MRLKAGVFYMFKVLALVAFIVHIFKILSTNN